MGCQLFRRNSLESKFKSLIIDYFTSVSQKITRENFLENLERYFIDSSSKNETPTLIIPTTEPDNAWLLFSSKVTRFVGRQKELEELHDFTLSARPFSWWALTGPGGSGKSRLALEICELCQSESWDAGFLQRIDEEQYWSQFNPTNNTLVIIDYVANRASFVSEVILRLSTMQHESNCKIRILLIERDRNHWWNVVCREDSSSEEIIVLGSLYNEVPLALPALDNAELVNIAKDIFEARGRVWTDKEKNYLTRRISKTDYANLPLFAMILVEYPDDVDRDQLIRTILRREAARRKLLISQDDKENQINNLIFLATLAGGIRPQSGSFRFLEQLTISGDIPPITGYDLRLYSNLVGAPNQVEFLSGLQPDLLGERFVLDCMSTNGVDSLIYKELYLEACKIQQEDVIAFVARSIGDFPEDVGVRRFFDIDINDEDQRLFKSKLLAGVSTLFDPLDNFLTEQIDCICALANHYTEEVKLQKHTAMVEYNHGVSMMAWSCSIPQFLRPHFHQIAEDRLQSALSRISENTKMGVTVLLNLGVLLHSRNSRERAANLFSQVIGSDQANTETIACALNNRANIYFNLGEHKKAIEDRTKVLSLEQTSPDRRFVALFRRGESFVALDDHKACALDMTEIMESHSDISRPDKLLARIVRAINYRKYGEENLANMELQSVIDSMIPAVSEFEDEQRITEVYRLINDGESDRASKILGKIDANEKLVVRLCHSILYALIEAKIEKTAPVKPCPWDELEEFVYSTANRYRFASLDMDSLFDELTA